MMLQMLPAKIFVAPPMFKTFELLLEKSSRQQRVLKPFGVKAKFGKRFLHDALCLYISSVIHQFKLPFDDLRAVFA